MAKNDAAPEEASEAVVASSPSDSGSSAAESVSNENTNVWNDDMAESAFRAEARERGEVVSAPKPKAEEVADEADSKNLPPLDALVQRIPPEVRDALDDLFRARFTTVKRVPKKALKP